MKEKNNNIKEEKIISLLIKGIIKLYEKEGKNFSKLNRELKRAINILAAENKVIIQDRSQMIQVLSETIGSWYDEDSIYKDEKLIIDGIPTDFCYEMVIDSFDIESEIDQGVILEIKNEFKAYGKEEDYTKFRVFLIKNPIVARKKIEEFIIKNSNYNPNKKGYMQDYMIFMKISQNIILI